MAYDYEKQTCDRCGASKKQREKLPPMPTGINHPEYCKTKSFSLGFNGEVHCPECAKEIALEKLFAAMDQKEKNGGTYDSIRRAKS